MARASWQPPFALAGQLTRTVTLPRASTVKLLPTSVEPEAPAEPAAPFVPAVPPGPPWIGAAAATLAIVAVSLAGS